jgi:hypothetical protein
MRILLVHPEDSPRVGSWTAEKWDVLIDLGKSSEQSAAAWAESYRCKVIRSDSFRGGIADALRVREILAAYQGRILDSEGIDCWELISLLIAPEVFSVLALQSIAAQIPTSAEVWVTRRSFHLVVLETLLGRNVRCLRDSNWERSSARVRHYWGVFRRFPAAQLRQIVLDKYDSGYRWRSRFAARAQACPAPVVVIPSAYENVSRMAASYASLVPDQQFLLVATRQSAKRAVFPGNVELRDLAAYTNADLSANESETLLQLWAHLRLELADDPVLGILEQVGALDSSPTQLINGIRARNAWRNVLQSEPVLGVFCGDDSNLYTRLPVALARKRGIPTLDFHHGALDGRYLLKQLASDLYLAKNEMEWDYLARVCGLPAERVVIGAPFVDVPAMVRADSSYPRSAVLFSEPYEAAGLRVDEVYREVLPPLCHLARQNKRSVVIKLHPFENRLHRASIVRDILSNDDQKIIKIVDGPLMPDLIAQAWFGITVESTTVIECLQRNVCCFLCGWLSLSRYEYSRQYARFGIGEILDSADDIREIPIRLQQFQSRSKPKLDLSPTVDPSLLQQWLTSRRPSIPARSLS